MITSLQPEVRRVFVAAVIKTWDYIAADSLAQMPNQTMTAQECREVTADYVYMFSKDFNQLSPELRDAILKEAIKYPQGM